MFKFGWCVAVLAGSFLVITGCQNQNSTSIQNQMTINHLLSQKYSITQVRGNGIQPRQYIVCGDIQHPCPHQVFVTSQQTAINSKPSASTEDCQPCTNTAIEKESIHEVN
jgi:hypothetical protein